MSPLAAGACQLYDAGPDARTKMGRRGLAFYREQVDCVAVTDRGEALLYGCATKHGKGGFD